MFFSHPSSSTALSPHGIRHVWDISSSARCCIPRCAAGYQRTVVSTREKQRYVYSMHVYAVCPLYGQSVTDGQLPSSIKEALKQGITSFDTAKLYGNEKALSQLLKGEGEDILIQTKVYEPKLKSVDTLNKGLRDSGIRVGYGPHKKRVLLHHPAPPHVYMCLEEAVRLGQFDEIGVCNHNEEALRNLLSYAKIRPCVNQLEVHPFLPNAELDSVLEYCAREGIPVEAHSILAKGVYLDHPALVAASSQAQLSPAQYLVAFALQRCQRIIVQSTNAQRLAELLSVVRNPVKLEEERFFEPSLRMYPYQVVSDTLFNSFTTPEKFASQIHLDLAALKRGSQEERESISDAALIVGCAKRVSALTKSVALAMFPSLAPHESRALQAFKDKCRPLRKFCFERDEKRQRAARDADKGGVCSLKKRLELDGLQFSEQVTEPRAMPVDIAEAQMLEPFFRFLRSKGSTLPDKEFVRGAAFSDGRMDMCKQVVGSTHVEALCEAVGENPFVRHFLLGNNIAFEGAPEKAAAMATLMAEDSKPIETWYLAGNCIDAEALQVLCHALKTNTVAKSLWLKRNPLRATGMYHMRSMLQINRTLTTLDLHNTGILDEGVEILAQTSPCALKHLYLDANGITAAGAHHLAQFLSRQKDVIKTLYVSINRIGDEGAVEIARSLHESTTLKRISMGSNRLTDACANILVDCLLSCPNLIMVDLGCYKSTFDMGERSNFFTNEDPFVRLLKEHPKLEFLDLIRNSLSLEAVSKILEAAAAREKKTTIVAMQSPAIGNKESKEGYRLTNHAQPVLKLIKHPKCVVYIDSIYRNAM